MIAPPTSGPRQMIGWPAGTKNWIEMAFTPCRVERDDLVVGALRRLALEPEHERDVGAGDVGVEEPDRRAVPRQRDGEIHRDRALADAALARGNGEDVLDARQQLLRRARRGAPDAWRPT